MDGLGNQGIASKAFCQTKRYSWKELSRPGFLRPVLRAAGSIPAGGFGILTPRAADPVGRAWADVAGLLPVAAVGPLAELLLYDTGNTLSVALKASGKPVGKGRAKKGRA